MKSETTQHTPTPWHFDTKMMEFIPKSQGGGEKITIHGGGKRIGTLNRADLSEAKANAAYIVLAVNSHQELLDACKYLLLCHRNDPKAIINPDAIRLAEKAIQKAEGKI